MKEKRLFKQKGLQEIKEEAIKKLTAMRAQNGRKAKYGDLSYIIKKTELNKKCGFKFYNKATFQLQSIVSSCFYFIAG